MDEYIIKDRDGNLLISITKEPKETIRSLNGLTHCLAIVKVGEDYLLGWNKWRNRWEIFGGCIEKGEDPDTCVARECFEELGIENRGFTYIGLMKLLLKPDYFSEQERIEYGVLYGVSLSDTSINEIESKLKDRDEIGNISLYNSIPKNQLIAEIDEKLLEYY